jgi:hypothetical protein
VPSRPSTGIPITSVFCERSYCDTIQISIPGMFAFTPEVVDACVYAIEIRTSNARAQQMQVRPEVGVGSPAKHSDIKLECFGLVEVYSFELSVSEVQQDVPFARDRCRAHEHSYCPAGVDPLVPKPAQRLVPALVPVGRQRLQADSLNLKRPGNLALNRDAFGCRRGSRFTKVSIAASAREVEA